MAIEIREARPDEHEAAGVATVAGWRPLADPNDRGWLDYLGEIADVRSRARLAPVLVAVEDGRILGSATVDLDGAISDVGDAPPGSAVFRMLGVAPEAQGRGVGRLLVLGCMDLARARGKQVVLLHTGQEMKAARHLYESMGFERDPGRDHHGDDGFVLFAYRKAL